MIDQEKTFVIAEAGVNHNGSLDMALKLIDVAKKAGADAVKFQTFKSNKVISKMVKMADYQKKNIGKDESQLEMIKKLELDFNSFIKIKEYCDKIGITFLSSPFDKESADFLEDLVPYYKIPSGEVINLPFLEHIAKKNKPMIVSTGMSYLGEVENAVRTIMKTGNKNITLLHCTTNYPTPYEEVNLKAMLTLKEAFKLPVGYSDHTLGIEVPIAAVALGAKVIEKHFTLDRTLPGPDHKASLEPDELKSMVDSIRNIEKALGDGIKKPNPSEEKIKNIVRKRLVASRNLNAGEIISETDISIKRSNTGLSPEYYNVIVGRKLIKKIEEDEGFTLEHFMEGGLNV